MLTKIFALPADKKIAGVHCVPITSEGTIVMAWDRPEQVLTTIGGRIEGEESIADALKREAIEEAGLLLKDERVPFAAWYWTNTDTYTVFYLSKVERFTQMPPDFEKTGYVIFSFETAEQIISRLEDGYNERIQILRYAKERAGEIGWI